MGEAIPRGLELLEEAGRDRDTEAAQVGAQGLDPVPALPSGVGRGHFWRQKWRDDLGRW